METSIVLLINTWWWAAHLPNYCLHVISCCGQADAQHNGVRGGGQDAGDDGFPHGERQHGVNHKHNEQEEGYLQREKKKKTCLYHLKAVEIK